MEILLQTAGVALQGSGLALLYLSWRAPRRAGGAALAAGWTLIGLGALPWLLHAAPERGLAIAMLAPMLAGLLLLAPDGLGRIGAGAEKRQARTEPNGAADAPAPGQASRNAARWMGGLIAAPAFALAAAGAWQAFFPGTIVDRIAFSLIALIAAWTAALLWLLASLHPWRIAYLLSVSALALGGGAYAFAALGGA